jgi:hypothetical protein
MAGAELVVPDPPEVVLARVSAAIAPLGWTAVDDALELRFSARPGDAPLVGEVKSNHLRVWRRGSGNWVGLSAFTGDVRATGSGSQIIGRTALRTPTLVANGVALTLVAVVLAVASWLGWPDLVAAAPIAALGLVIALLMQRRDRRRLMAVLTGLVGAHPVAR